jgi:hypothetical protein
MSSFYFYFFEFVDVFMLYGFYIFLGINNGIWLVERTMNIHSRGMWTLFFFKKKKIISYRICSIIAKN